MKWFISSRCKYVYFLDEKKNYENLKDKEHDNVKIQF